VIPFGDGKGNECGGNLLDTLKQALERGKNRRAQIAVWFPKTQLRNHY
jgi:hypothetical protein